MKPIEEKIGYCFQDQRLLAQAMTHASVGGADSSYERLEFLGDRVLSLVIAQALLEHFPKEQEGPLAKRLAHLVSAPVINQVAQPFALHKYVSTTAQHAKNSPKLVADLCESLIGAIYIDQGLDAARAFIMHLWAPLLQSESILPQESKTALQELTQARGESLPTYELVERTGPEHRAHFKVEACALGKRAMGEGSTLRNAEKNAAEILLKLLQESTK